MTSLTELYPQHVLNAVLVNGEALRAIRGNLLSTQVILNAVLDDTGDPALRIALDIFDKETLTRNLPGGAVGDYIEVGSFDVSHGQHNLIVTASYIGGAGITKTYLIPIDNNATAGAWKRAKPIVAAGESPADDWDIYVKSAGTILSLRLWRVAGTPGTNTTLVNLINLGDISDAFTPATASGNAFPPSAIYDGTPIFTKQAADLTQGSIPFADANGKLTQDNAQLFWDDTNDYLGIGVNTPSKGKVEISGTGQGQIVTYYFLSGTSGAGGPTGPTTINYSLWADGRIASPEFDAISDEREKDIIGDTDSHEDLETVRKLRVVNFKYKDPNKNGGREVKKLIAQQVATIFPQAISIVKAPIPDIMRKATLDSGSIKLKDHGLNTGDRVKIIFYDYSEATHEIKTVPDADMFTIDSDKNGEVFVYGREVDDYHLIDYDAIAMLNVSAVQELVRKIHRMQREIEDLKGR